MTLIQIFREVFNLNSSSGITIESVLWNIVQVCDQDMEVKVPEVTCEIQKEEKLTENKLEK